MIHNESDHPTNQSRNEILGRVAGGFSIRESSANCTECGQDLDHGKHVTMFFTWICPSIYHRWARKAMFCRACYPRDLSADVLEGLTRANNEVLVTGALRDKGHWGTYREDGETVKRWTRQDGKWAEFAPTRIEALDTEPGMSGRVTDVGPNQFMYKPETHGSTVPVPAAALAALVSNTTLEDDAATEWDPASANPVRWATALLHNHSGYRADGD